MAPASVYRRLGIVVAILTSLLAFALAHPEPGRAVASTKAPLGGVAEQGS